MDGNQQTSANSASATLKAPPEPAVIAIGPWNQAEFAATLPDLRGSATWSFASSPAAAAAALAHDSAAAEVALVACPRPGYFSSSELLQLQQTAPLLRVVLVAGTWCEGELRTGSPPDGFLRLYWYELPSWWEAAVAADANGHAPPWSSPPRDRFQGPEFAEQPRRVAEQHAVVINALDYSVFEALAAALAPHGWLGVWQSRRRPAHRPAAGGQAVAAGIFDAGQLDDAEMFALRQFVDQLAPRDAPTIVLLDYPRVEHVERIRAAGAAAMLPKPYRVEAVATMLKRRAVRG